MGGKHPAQIPFGVGHHTQPCCRSEEMIEGAQQVGHRDLVAMTGEDPVDGEAADAERELRGGLREIPGRPAQRLGVRSTGHGEAEGQVKVASILGCGKPFAAIAACLGKFVTGADG